MHAERATHLRPAIAVADALCVWHGSVELPHHRLWVDINGYEDWTCKVCQDPRDLRQLLGFVMYAMPRHHARRLRRLVSQLDEAY